MGGAGEPAGVRRSRLRGWAGRCLAGRGGASAVSPPSLSLSPSRSVSPRPHRQPRTTKCPLEPPPCPALCVSIRAFPGRCQLEMVIPALCGAVRSRGQPWERLAAAAVAADASPNVPLRGGCDRECRTFPGAARPPSLCLCPLAAGTGPGAALRVPPAAHPCPSSPSRVAGAVCAPPTALLDCWKLSGKEVLFPLGLPGGTVTSGGCRGVTCPAQTLPAALVVFPEFSGLGACGW